MYTHKYSLLCGLSSCKCRHFFSLITLKRALVVLNIEIAMQRLWESNERNSRLLIFNHQCSTAAKRKWVKLWGWNFLFPKEYLFYCFSEKQWFSFLDTTLRRKSNLGMVIVCPWHSVRSCCSLLYNHCFLFLLFIVIAAYSLFFFISFFGDYWLLLSPSKPYSYLPICHQSLSYWLNSPLLCSYFLSSSSSSLALVYRSLTGCSRVSGLVTRTWTWHLKRRASYSTLSGPLTLFLYLKNNFFFSPVWFSTTSCSHTVELNKSSGHRAVKVLCHFLWSLNTWRSHIFQEQFPSPLSRQLSIKKTLHRKRIKEYFVGVGSIQLCLSLPCKRDSLTTACFGVTHSYH